MRGLSVPALFALLAFSSSAFSQQKSQEECRQESLAAHPPGTMGAEERTAEIVACVKSSRITAPRTAAKEAALLTLVAGRKFHLRTVGKAAMTLELNASGKGILARYPGAAEESPCRGELPTQARVLANGKLQVTADLLPGMPDWCGQDKERQRSWVFDVSSDGNRLSTPNEALVFEVR